MATNPPKLPPQSILIIGAGVFGLTTAATLASLPYYASTRITLLDPSPASDPNPHTASTDTSRIIRADYADAAYAALATRAQRRWRETDGPEAWGADGRYSECGLCLVAGAANAEYVRGSLANVKAALAAEEADGGDDDYHGNKNNDRDAPLQEINSAADLVAAMGLPARAVGASGVGAGYLNRRSGWADAEASMRWLRARVRNGGRVQFVQGEAERLEVENGADGVRVVGARIKGGSEVQVVRADVTVVAAGAWSGKLVDLRGVASARVQCMLYVRVTAEEAERLKGIPVFLDLSSGCFFFPPTQVGGVSGRREGRGGEQLGLESFEGDEEWEIKVARHAFGYANPVAVNVEQMLPVPGRMGKTTTATETCTRQTTGPKKASISPPPEAAVKTTTKTKTPTTAQTKISLPPPPSLPIPATDKTTLLNTLYTILPDLAPPPPPLPPPSLSSSSSPPPRPPPKTPTPPPRKTRTRHCTYLDTPAADFLITPVPGYGASILLATAGSGHAFKFAPVLGRCVVRILERAWAGAGAGAGAGPHAGRAGCAPANRNEPRETDGHRSGGGDVHVDADADADADAAEDALLDALERRWRWSAHASMPTDEADGDDGVHDDDDDDVWCMDGSRAGARGLVLHDALASGGETLSVEHDGRRC